MGERSSNLGFGAKSRSFVSLRMTTLMTILWMARGPLLETRESGAPHRLSFSSPRDGFARFLVGGSSAFGFALVPELFAFGQG